MSINISSCDISDKSLLVFANNHHPKIEDFYMSGCQKITYDAFKTLIYNCKQLRLIDIEDIQNLVSIDMNEIELKFPELNIYTHDKY
jgi:hypothetical protein